MIIPLAFAALGLFAAVWWSLRTIAGEADMPAFMFWLLPLLGGMVGAVVYGLLWRLFH